MTLEAKPSKISAKFANFEVACFCFEWCLRYIFAMDIIIKMKVDFQLQTEEGDTSTFIANGEWALLGMFGRIKKIRIISF